jgi:zinc/manganese transport system substrate-binding protein
VRPLHAAAAVLAALVLAIAASGCGTGAASADDGRLRVVAAESVWGSVAAQLGGQLVAASSVISSPAADPHDYEPTASDARAMAAAQLAIVNGVGYDAWASKLLAADGAGGEHVLDVGKLVGVASGGNPHRWYSPGDVLRVADEITARYARLDPAHAARYAALHSAFARDRLAGYRASIAAIRARYRGVAVGASESIASPLVQALGLRMATPSSFLGAVSEGADPTASDEAAAASQIDTRAIAVWLLNTQNETPDIQRLTAAARARGIPVVALTETPTPAGASFEAWQGRQLAAIARALAEATGR